MTDEKEQKAFIELKRRMEGDMEKELYEDDNMFYRFLRARDVRIDAAEAMLRDHLEFRKKYDVKNILEYEPPEVLGKYFPMKLLGLTKDGFLLRFIPSGRIDCRGIMASCTMEEWAKYFIKSFETDLVELKKQTKKIGRLVDKVVYIHNLKGFTLSKAMDRKVLLQFYYFTNMYQDNYPETLKAIYCIHAPTYFSIIYTALKSFLPSNVIGKIHIYSDDSWRKDLLEIIDADVLPAFLGGKKTDPDRNPLCNTFVNHGDIVPEEYQIRKKEVFANLPGVQRIVLQACEVKEISLEVKEYGSQLKWGIGVRSGDIKFGITYINDGGKKDEMVELKRIAADDFVEIGTCNCENIGTYIMHFDNSYSFLKSKDVMFRTEIISK